MAHFLCSFPALFSFAVRCCPRLEFEVQCARSSSNYQWESILQTTEKGVIAHHIWHYSHDHVVTTNCIQIGRLGDPLGRKLATTVRKCCRFSHLSWKWRAALTCKRKSVICFKSLCVIPQMQLSLYSSDVSPVVQSKIKSGCDWLLGKKPTTTFVTSLHGGQ